MEENTPKSLFRFDTAEFLRLCIKQWKWFAASVFVFCLIGGFYGLTHKPATVVQAQVMLPTVSGQNSMVLDIAKNFSLGDMFSGSSSTDNEAAVMGSYDQFLRTTKKLDLNVGYSFKGRLNWFPTYLKAPLRLTYDKSIADTLTIFHLFDLTLRDNGRWDATVKLNKKKAVKLKDQPMPLTFDLPTGKFTINPTEFFSLLPKNVSRFRVTLTGWNYAAQGLAQSVVVAIPSKKTDFISLTYSTNEPRFGELLLNTVIESYNEIGDNQKDLRNNRTLKLVNERLASLNRELSTSETQIEAFKRQHNLTDFEADAKLLLTKVGTLDNALLLAETENEILRSTRDFISDPANRYQLIPALTVNVQQGGTSSSSMPAADAITEYNRLVLERMKLLNSATPNNITLKSVTAQIDALYETIKESVDQAYRNSSISLRDVRAESGSTKSTINTIPALEREFLGMKRQQMVQEQLYLFLLKQREEASISLNNSTASCLVIDNPHALAKKAGLSLMKLLMVFAFLGFLVGGILVFVLRYRRIAFSNPASLADLLTVPALCSAPDSLTPQPEAPGVQTLRADFIFTMREFQGKRALVTAPAPGQGHSAAALQLAAALADLGKNTLLIDADLRSCPYGAGAGLADVAAGAAPQSVIVDDFMGAKGLHGIRAGKADNPARTLASPAVAALISHAAQQFDYVIINAPSLAFSDAYALADSVGATLMALRADRAKPADLKRVDTLAAEGRLPRIAALAVTD